MDCLHHILPARCGASVSIAGWFWLDCSHGVALSGNCVAAQKAFADLGE